MNYETAEEAAVAGFPRGVARVIASSVHGTNAYVLLDTGPTTHRYLYGTLCHYVDGGWVEGRSSNGGGWRASDRDDDLGLVTLWDDAPNGADRVRASFGDHVSEVAVDNGGYLFAWWDVPYPTGHWPRVVAYRIDGEWVKAPNRFFQF